MMNPIGVELKAHIRIQIHNYEELSQLITTLQDSHAWVFRSMDVVVHAHVIPSIGTLTEEKAKTQVQLELDLYFDKWMRITTNAYLAISADTMN